MTKELYEARDKIASHSYTLHLCNKDTDVIAYGDIDALRSMFKGNVTFKRSASGMQTTCYLHFFGDALVKTTARGCGYDVQSEAMRLALVKLQKTANDADNKSIIERLLAGFKDGLEWKRHFETQGILAAHIGN